MENFAWIPLSLVSDWQSLVPERKKNVLQASQPSVLGLGSADRCFCT